MAEDDGSRDAAQGSEEGGGIDLREWSDLDRLDGEMEVLAGQLLGVADWAQLRPRCRAVRPTFVPRTCAPPTCSRSPA